MCNDVVIPSTHWLRHRPINCDSMTVLDRLEELSLWYNLPYVIIYESR
nr:MAG TPA: hypothetical protein [Caudoviricetes sp.]